MTRAKLEVPELVSGVLAQICDIFAAMHDMSVATVDKYNPNLL